MSNLKIALEMTGLGMGLVFAAIILLWGMMNLLTLITADRKHDSDSAQPAPAAESELKARAAAVAVAIALAEQENSLAHTLCDPPTAIVSAWQLGMRTRQLQQKGPIRRPRKIG
jgi:Na+-transporting methylmalonyl-CoA/oxaloacetate decarboxylase gamma subunit